MTAKPVKVSWVSDSSALRNDVDKIGNSFDGAAADAKAAGSKIDSALDSTAGHADDVASKGAQAAGGLSGLGDLVGGKFGAAMVTGGIAMQAFADAGDLVNVVTESAIFRKIKDTAVTVAQTTATIAKTIADKAAAAASKAWAAAQWLLNAALTANPIGLVVVAIVALVAAIVIAWKKSETFRTIVTGAFSKVQAAASAAFGWVKRNWPLILAILTGPIGLAVLAIGKNWDKITGGAAAVKKFVVDRFNELVTFANNLKNRFSFGGMWDGIKEAFRSAINYVIGKWNNLSFSLPSVNTHIPGVGTVGGFTLSTPNIPLMASGGIVNRATLAVIGEAGPEAVIPLDRLGGGPIRLNVTLTAQALDQLTRGRAIRADLDAWENQGGRVRA